MNIINIYENYNSYFASDLKDIFNSISNQAENFGCRVYLIGGLVRDMLLGCESLDIDITVEGNAIEFVNFLVSQGLAEIKSIHKDFGTVKVLINTHVIDFASTRSEQYPRKGHLPVIDEIGCSLEKDVLRRDFTINSLAMSLDKTDFGSLIDYVGGYDDLKIGVVRVLHSQSFIDDPTRILRALKYSSRLGFRLDFETKKYQEEYLKNINYDVCQKRLKQEFRKTFNNADSRVFNKFIDEKIYKLYTTRDINQIDSLLDELILKYKPTNRWLIYFSYVITFEDFSRFELTRNETKTISDAKKNSLMTFKTDFDVYKAFSQLSIESLLSVAISGEMDQVLRYIEILSKIKLGISGEDLISIGYKPSAKFTKVFEHVLSEKLKNPKLTKSQELEFAKKILSE